VAKVEKQLSAATDKLSNTELQVMLVREIQGIKHELQEIKQHIGINGKGAEQASFPIHQQQEEPE
jgi:hypothetical protein